VFGRDWGGFVGVNLFCVWDNLVWFCGSECVLCVGQFEACLEIVILCCLWENFSGLGGLNLCCVGESLGRVWE